MLRFGFLVLLAGCTAQNSSPSSPSARTASQTQAPATAGQTSSSATNQEALGHATATYNQPTLGHAGDPPTSEPKGRLAGMLLAHNQARAQHCAPPLTWSTELAAYAQEWAESLRDRGCAFEHRQRSPYGENLAYLGPAGIGTAAGVTNSWVDERQRYDFARGDFGFDTGHFTQIVWRDTKSVGCAVTTCGQRAELWVCNYSPAGNVIGEFRKQVLPTSCQ